MDEIKKTQDEMKKLGKEVIHLKHLWNQKQHSRKEDKEDWWKACELGEPIQFTLQQQSRVGEFLQ